MATKARDPHARRRRILQGSQDRLNLITGRVSTIPSTDSLSSLYDEDASTASRAQSPPLVSRDLDPMPHLSDFPPEKPTDSIVSRHDQAAESNQNDSYDAGIKEEPSLRRRGTSNDLPRASSPEITARPEPSPATRRQHAPASLPEKLLAPLVNLFGSVTSQQLNTAISTTAKTRRVISIIMSLLVLLSYFGFPIVSNKIIRSILLFRPLFLLILMNMSLVILRLMAEFEHGKKDTHKLSGSEGVSWAEEAGRALEVGLMLQNVFGSLFMDFSVYVLIIVCGFCLAS